MGVAWLVTRTFTLVEALVAELMAIVTTATTVEWVRKAFSG